MDLKEENILGESVSRHWYYASKLGAVRRLLRGLGIRSILDVGAGSGFFGRSLLRETKADRCQCVDINYPADRDTVEAGKPVLFRRQPEDIAAHDLILFIDVLEHVEDDAGFLAHYVAGAAEGTHVLLSVPAFPSLWSGHDVFLGHHRRYRLRQLEELARRAGLDVVRGRYFFGLLFPLVALVRMAKRGVGTVSESDLRPAPTLVNGALRLLCDIEARLLLPVNRLCGVTAFCLARKPRGKQQRDHQ
ncbi:methyltransferase domain-containing protein [Zavarzinia aquatilis]|uniref:Methyltransferase n=1 Tax=Zavarzinia aquatilis TaxID=2211142 RepID=A0A317EHW5_9PROT|nr:methyltransferase domain-containing protein [Zavarzinia aquatilis]PWR25023.1 methyltransferase [Zavarzinia aquatilis]